MAISDTAAVTFIGKSNVMTTNCKNKCKDGGKTIYSDSPSLKFSICKPGTMNTPKTYSGNSKIEIDYY
mgnify:CR=1 FL=1